MQLMPVFFRDKSVYLLIIIYLMIVASISLRSYVEATNYCSPDSEFYLRVASNILNGKGIIAPQEYPFDERTPESHFAVWPVAYPFMIALGSKITSLNVLVASKLVNLLFLGLIFILMFHWFKEGAWFPALYFFSYSKMEVFSYTWSEGPFLFFLLLLCYFLAHLETKYLVIKVAMCLLLMFLLRYAALVHFVGVGCFAVYLLVRRYEKKGLKLLLSVCIAAVPCLLYLWNNKYHSGFYTGLKRFTPEEISNWFSFSSSLVGVGNEFLWARNYFILHHNFTWIFALFLIIELILGYYLFRKRHYMEQPILNHSSKVLIATGLFYLLGVIILQRLHACAHFDYRILAPFSTPIALALFYAIFQQKIYFLKTWKWIMAFMLICFAMNLPKIYLWGLVF